jgi:hypothetical protein
MQKCENRAPGIEFGGSVKKFGQLKDDNGTTLKTYVEMMQEKAADHGLLTVNIFFNPDESDPEKAFHTVSNSGEFVNILAAYLLWVKRSQSIPGPEESNIEVVKPRE